MKYLFLLLLTGCATDLPYIESSVPSKRLKPIYINSSTEAITETEQEWGKRECEKSTKYLNILLKHKNGNLEARCKP